KSDRAETAAAALEHFAPRKTQRVSEGSRGSLAHASSWCSSMARGHIDLSYDEASANFASTPAQVSSITFCAAPRISPAGMAFKRPPSLTMVAVQATLVVFSADANVSAASTSALLPM